MDVIDELKEFEDRIDRAHVERRVIDWQQRIEDLYGHISAWLPVGWTAAREGNMPMYESLMRKFGIGERILSQLLLRHGDVEMVRLEPRDLWIIGLNGRLDLVGPPRHHIINDRADLFEAPDWRIAAFHDRFFEVPSMAETLVQASS